MSSFWWVDRALPGIVSGSIMALAVALSHLLLHRHITRVTERQNAHIDELTAAQTAALTGSGPQPGRTAMTETPASPPQASSLHVHVPHPHLKHRAEAGPVTVAKPGGSRVARFNTRAAVLVTRTVGTMYTAYLFALIAFYGLPTAIHGGPSALVLWVSSEFLQLVLLPIIIVGSAVLAEVTDRLAKRQFDDVELLIHGQDQQAQHLAAQDDKILAILAAIEANTAVTEEARDAARAAGKSDSP